MGTSSEAQFFLNNNGGATATLLSDSGRSRCPSSTRGHLPGTGGNCGTTLASGSSCLLVVVFAPGTPTTSAGLLGINYHDGLGGTPGISRSLSGTGTP